MGTRRLQVPIAFIISEGRSVRINKYHVQVLVVEFGMAILAASVIFVAVWVRTLPQSPRAQAFIADFEQLDVGRSTFEQVDAIAHKHGGVPWWSNDGSMRCTRESCAFEFVFENKPLSSVHLVPWTGLTFYLKIENGVLIEKSLSYHRHAQKPMAYNVSERQSTSERRGINGALGLTRMNVNSEGIPYAVSIDLGPTESAEKRKLAYAIDTSCLSKLFNCNSPSAFFPTGIPYRGGPYQTYTEKW